MPPPPRCSSARSDSGGGRNGMRRCDRRRAGDAMTRGQIVRMFAAAACGRLAIYLLFAPHWSWQPPYHLVYLQPPDFYDPESHEYLVAHMPAYWAFLAAVRAVSPRL